MISTRMNAVGGSAVAFTMTTFSPDIGRWRPCHVRGATLFLGFAVWRHQIDQAHMDAVSTRQV
jgi:hypothetical protein